MVRFIRQEAEEKANGISVSAEEEFNIEKLSLLEAEKRKIRQEFERKTKQVQACKKIEYSMQLNASRIQVLQAQDDVVKSIKVAASKQLLRVSEFKTTEGASSLGSMQRGRLNLLNLFWRRQNGSMQRQPKYVLLMLLLTKNVYLPPPPASTNSHEPYCSGGVVLASQDGKIVCENTLDARLDVFFRHKLPQIRKRLLGKKVAV